MHPVKHPAPFSAELIPHLIEACDGFRRGVMLDPFAGIGRKIRRRTYRISLGRPLTKGNGGAFHFGREYKHLHRDVWAGCFRVLKPGGILVLNISDHVRKGVEVPVTDWHVSTLQDLGFMLEDVVAVTTRRFREGQNGDKRMENEWIIKLRRPGDVVDADRRDHFDRVR